MTAPVVHEPAHGSIRRAGAALAAGPAAPRAHRTGSPRPRHHSTRGFP